MDAERLIELLRSQEVEENKNELMEYQNTDPIGLATQLAQILLLDECNTTMAQLCAVNLKAVLMMCSRLNVEKFIGFWAQFPEGNKQVLRDGLVRGLTFDDPNILPNAVSEIISLICYADFAENIWHEVIDLLLGIIQSEDYVPNAKYACILTINEILRRPIKWIKNKNKETFKSNTIEACKFILEKNPDSQLILTVFDTFYRCLSKFKISLKREPATLSLIADYFLAVKSELSSCKEESLSKIIEAMYRYAVIFCTEYSKTESQDKVEEVIQAIITDLVSEESSLPFRTNALVFVTRLAKYEFRCIGDQNKPYYDRNDSYIAALSADMIEPIIQLLFECDNPEIECGSNDDTTISQYAKRALSYICRIVPEACDTCFEFFTQAHRSEDWNERFAAITAATAMLMAPSENVKVLYPPENQTIQEYISQIFGGDPSVLAALLADEAPRVRYMALSFVRRTIRHFPGIIRSSENAETMAAHIMIALQADHEPTASMGWGVAREFFDLYNPSMDNFTNKLTELDAPFVAKYFELLSADFALSSSYTNMSGTALMSLMRDAPHTNIDLRKEIIQQAREYFATLDGPESTTMQCSIILIQAMAVGTMLEVSPADVNECAAYLLNLAENEELFAYVVGSIGVLLRKCPEVLESCPDLFDQAMSQIVPHAPSSHTNLLLIFMSDVFQHAPESISDIGPALDYIISFTQEVMTERTDDLQYALNAICYGIRVVPDLYPQFEERIVDIRRNIMDRQIEDKKSDYAVYGSILANLCLLNATCLLMNANNPDFFTIQNKREIFYPFRTYSPFYLTHTDSNIILNALLLMLGRVMTKEGRVVVISEVNARLFNSELNNPNIKNIIYRGRVKFYKYYRHNLLQKVVTSLISKA